MMIRPATEQDIPAITAIFNEAVVNSNAIWTEKQDTEAERLAWMKARLALGYPVLVAAEGPVVLGYGTFGDFRAFPGYRYSVEHSVYIHVDHRGRGLGRVIVDELVAAAARPSRLCRGRADAGGRAQVRPLARTRLHAARAGCAGSIAARLAAFALAVVLLAGQTG
jgi:GNAT superfamily N-acetyltransferase